MYSLFLKHAKHIYIYINMPFKDLGIYFIKSLIHIHEAKDPGGKTGKFKDL